MPCNQLYQVSISVCDGGEMGVECLNQDLLKSTFSDSVSCGKRGHKVHWSNRNANQCGLCMPCVYRRAALHKMNLDNEIYGNDMMAITPSSAVGDTIALIDYLKTPLDKEQIKRNLLVNSTLESSDLDRFSEVVINSRLEIRELIKNKGNKKLKNYLGIK